MGLYAGAGKRPGRALAFPAGAFSNPPATTRRDHAAGDLLEHEDRAVKRIDFNETSKSITRSTLACYREFDVDILVEQYAGRDEAEASYRSWRGGYDFG